MACRPRWQGILRFHHVTKVVPGRCLRGHRTYLSNRVGWANSIPKESWPRGGSATGLREDYSRRSICPGTRTSLADELLDLVKNALPEFFERLVVELLVAMGYGGSLKDAGKAIGRSGDEGIGRHRQRGQTGAGPRLYSGETVAGQQRGTQGVQAILRGALPVSVLAKGSLSPHRVSAEKPSTT